MTAISVSNNSYTFGDDLHLAAADGDLNEVKSLITGKTDVNQKDIIGDAPLHYAAMNNEWIVAKFLLDKGANIDLKGSSEQTALHYAADRGLADFVKNLIKSGAQINIQDAGGQTALHHALNFNPRRWTSKYEEMRFETAKVLINLKANLNVKNNKGETPLYLAAQNGNLQGVNLLISSRADRSIKANDDKTPYEIAESAQYEDIMQALKKTETTIQEDNEPKEIVKKKPIKKRNTRRRRNTRRKKTTKKEL